MEHYAIDELKKSEKFLKNIQWDITPRIFLAPRSQTKNESEKIEDEVDRYMLYVDLVYNKPAVVIMRLRTHMSKTVGYIEGVPETLLQDAMNCDAEECKAGMYPLTEELKKWLKNELGLS